jgi:hypothetical protein
MQVHQVEKEQERGCSIPRLCIPGVRAYLEGIPCAAGHWDAQDKPAVRFLCLYRILCDGMADTGFHRCGLLQAYTYIHPEHRLRHKIRDNLVPKALEGDNKGFPVLPTEIRLAVARGYTYGVEAAQVHER